MPEKIKKNLLGRTVTSSTYKTPQGHQGEKKTVTNKKGEVVRSKSKLSNNTSSSMRRGLMGRTIEKRQVPDERSRKVTSKSGNTREVKKSTERPLEGQKTIFTPDSIKKKQVLKNKALVKEKTTAVRNGKKVGVDTRKLSYGKDSVTQKQTLKQKPLYGPKKTTQRFVDRTELGGKSGKTPVSTYTTTGMGPVSQARTFRREIKKNK